MTKERKKKNKNHEVTEDRIQTKLTIVCFKKLKLEIQSS